MCHKTNPNQLVGLSLLVGACGVPLEECWQGQAFLSLPRMGFDLFEALL